MAAKTLTAALLLLALPAAAHIDIDIGIGAEAAHAHSIGHYADGTYPGRPHQERVFFGRHATGDAFRTRFIRAQDQWDNITSRFQFIIYDETLDASDPRRCAADQPRRFGEVASLINYQYIDGKNRKNNSVADTQVCSRASDGRLDWFATSVDTADEIYFGRGKAPPGRSDLGSIAVHELGHAAGFYFHYDDDETRDAYNASICRDNKDQQTMCASLHPGTERMRTLQDHDRHTHADAYNR